MLINALRGALAGAVGTWLMDQVTTTMLQSQPDEVTQQEREAQPNGKSSVANLVDMAEDATGFEVEEQKRPLVEQATHYALGAVPGALYAVLRRRVPLLGAKNGVLFGLLLWAVNDEWLNIQLGLSGPFEAYPVETHWRGVVGHAVLGMATDTTLDLLGG